MENNIRYGKIDEFYSLVSRELKIPFFGTFELTPRCNMNCKMCYIRMDAEEMKKVGRELTCEEWLAIAQKAVDRGMLHLLLTGGEPLLYKDFKKLYLALRKMGLFISINTNGTMFNDEWFDFFAKYPPIQVNITVYGGSGVAYQNLCGYASGYDRMKHTVEKLQSLGIRVLLNCVITKQNFDDIEAIYQFGRDHDLEINATAYCFPPVRKEGVIDPELNRFDPKHAAIARAHINWESINDKDLFLKRADYLVKYSSSIDKNDQSCVDAVGEKVLCAAGRSNFWITWDGRMLPCGMIPDYSVKVMDCDFDSAWEEVVNYTKTITLSAECKNCKKKDICAPCAAKLKSETGVYDQKSQYMCDFVDEYIGVMEKSLHVFNK